MALPRDGDPLGTDLFRASQAGLGGTARARTSRQGSRDHRPLVWRSAASVNRGDRRLQRRRRDGALLRCAARVSRQLAPPSDRDGRRAGDHPDAEHTSDCHAAPGVLTSVDPAASSRRLADRHRVRARTVRVVVDAGSRPAWRVIEMACLAIRRRGVRPAPVVRRHRSMDDDEPGSRPRRGVDRDRRCGFAAVHRLAGAGCRRCHDHAAWFIPGHPRVPPHTVVARVSRGDPGDALVRPAAPGRDRTGAARVLRARRHALDRTRPAGRDCDDAARRCPRVLSVRRLGSH